MNNLDSPLPPRKIIPNPIYTDLHTPKRNNLNQVDQNNITESKNPNIPFSAKNIKNLKNRKRQCSHDNHYYPMGSKVKLVRPTNGLIQYFEQEAYVLDIPKIHQSYYTLQFNDGRIARCGARCIELIDYYIYTRKLGSTLTPSLLISSFTPLSTPPFAHRSIEDIDFVSKTKNHQLIDLSNIKKKKNNPINIKNHNSKGSSISPLSSQHLPSHSISPHSLKEGDPIVLRSREYLPLHLHKYACQPAFLTKVPISPDTWYQVKLTNNHILKIRAGHFNISKSMDSSVSLSIGQYVFIPLSGHWIQGHITQFNESRVVVKTSCGTQWSLNRQKISLVLDARLSCIICHHLCSDNPYEIKSDIIMCHECKGLCHIRCISSSPQYCCHFLLHKPLLNHKNNKNTASSRYWICPECQATIAHKAVVIADLNEELNNLQEWPCRICGGIEDDENSIVCDGCDDAFHLYCLTPPLIKLPPGYWYCPSCKEQGQK